MEPIIMSTSLDIDPYWSVYWGSKEPPVEYTWYGRYDYVADQAIRIEPANVLNVLLAVFGSVAKIATSIVSGNFAAALTGIMDFPEKVAEAQKRAANAGDVKGFITTLAQLGESAYKDHEDRKEKTKVNKNSVKDILKNAKKFPDDPSTYGKN